MGAMEIHSKLLSNIQTEQGLKHVLRKLLCCFLRILLSNIQTEQGLKQLTFE